MAELAKHHNSFSWDDWQSHLVHMTGEGLSASEMANELSRLADRPVSRNAVIGRLHRTGIWTKVTPALNAERASQRAKAAAARRSAEKDAVKTAKPGAAAAVGFPKPGRIALSGGAGFGTPKTVAAAPLPAERVDDAAIPLRQRRSLLQLTERTCKWPVGDPGTSGFFFCGAEKIEGRPYCFEHWCRAHEGMAAKKTRRDVA